MCDKKCGQQGLTCCDICNCIDFTSSKNTVEVEKTDTCIVDINITPNALFDLIDVKDGECISFVKEIIDGVLTITPVINWECVASQVCGLCPPPTPLPCAAPGELLINQPK